MQSKISLGNKELFKQITRNTGWVSIVYFLVLVFAIPLHLLMTATNEYTEFWKVETLFQYNNDIQIFALIIFPVLLAVFLFRFLHVKESSDLFHSLPIKREKIFRQYTITGLLFLIIPVILTTILVLIEHAVWNLDPYFSTGDIFYWAIVTIVLNIIVFMGAVFISMVTGISIVHGVLTYIFLLLPLGLILLVTYNLQFFLFGFAENYYFNNNIGYFSPLVIMDNLRSTDMNNSVLLIYGVISIILYVLALILYKKRKNEAVSQALVFPILKPIFKFGLTLCTALFAATYFGETQYNSDAWLFVGYVIGSIIGYLGAEMFIQKTWRVFGNLKSFLYYAGALVILFVSLQFDIIGFENRIPEVEEIKGVHLSDSPYFAIQQENEDKLIYLQSKENIELVHQLHEQLINDKKEVSNLNHDIAFIIYELENGKKLVREYSIDMNDYRDFYEPLYASTEFKEVNYPILQWKEDVVSISIQPGGPINRQVTISDRAEIKEAIELLKQDIYDSTFDEETNPRGLYSHISFTMMNEHPGDLRLKPTYTNFIKWLENKGQREVAMVTENDISHALIVEAKDLDIRLERGYGISNEDIYEKIKQSPNVLEIKEKNGIKTMIDHSSEYYFDNPKTEYLVVFYFEKEKFPMIVELDSTALEFVTSDN